MTDISKTHPSLKEYVEWTGTACAECANIYGGRNVEDYECVDIKYIQKHTIDKQVLREALLKEKSLSENCDGIIVNKKHYEYGKEETHNEYCVAINYQLEFIKRLLKELGLEEE